MAGHRPRARTAIGGGALVLLALDTASGAAPLHRQIFDAIRDGILQGRLRRGSRLPSTRSLAMDLRVARSTVVQAFDQLRTEGYIESVHRGATRIGRHVPDALMRAEPAASVRDAGRSRAPISPRVKALQQLWRRLPFVMDRPARPFRTSVPALDVFPIDAWGRLMARRWARSAPASLAYSEAGGLRALREAIADYLTTARGVRCSAEHVIVTSGSQQAIDLVARMLLGPRDRVWMEDPGYFGAGGAFVAAGARLVAVPVDAEGLNVGEGIRLAPRARLAYVTPARQLPLGVTLTLRRRVALLAWAASRRAWILEDDYDSEFRYSTRPLSSLQGLDRSGCVIFAGTFSKVMFPALRLGYLVVPDRLVDAASTVRRYADFCAPYLTQAVMADFMTGGFFERHIRRMRAIYQSRRALLAKLLTRELKGIVDVDAPDAGMNLIAWLPPRLADTVVADALGAAGIDAMPISAMTVRQRLRPGLILGFSGIRDAEIREGVARMRPILERLARR